ncbi:nuclear transport factor 2 family protein [Natrinema versiforme]|uniref:DUF4878 domain-containing protein n=1 Tax=Natrinema versiforme JCM 10478 TaxID=1227496 RepID=L9Y2B2_9EURY|nr:hypothetical protein [Natrinema versiforme]ELY66988.1 hypothetical protein C489_12132 [Natrinema versiforme JCM 10478]
MHRRRYLGLTAVVSAGLAGCAGSSGDDAAESTDGDTDGGTDGDSDGGTEGETDDGTSDGPDTVVERFHRALADGDGETANALVHSESPQGEVTDSDLSYYDGTDVTIENTEILSESDGVAEVRIEITMESDGESSTETFTYELRTENGEWKLYE